MAYAVGLSEGRAEIRVANLSRTPGAYTVPPVGADQWPAWSPRGSQIAFSDGRRIDVFSARTQRVRRVTDPGGCNDLYPTWQPGGTTLAFYRDCGSREGSGIYETGLAGRHLLWILRARGEGNNMSWPETSIQGFPSGISWSPDGATIALQTSSGGVWLVEAKIAPASQGPSLQNGRGQPMVVGPDTSSGSKGGYRLGYGSVSWSPDGRWIAFIRDSAIYEVDPRTRHMWPVAGTVGLQPVALSWR